MWSASCSVMPGSDNKSSLDPLLMFTALPWPIPSFTPSAMALVSRRTVSVASAVRRRMSSGLSPLLVHAVNAAIRTAATEYPMNCFDNIRMNF